MRGEGSTQRAGGLLLASASPRRLSLLCEHGFEAAVIDSGVDDGELRPGAVTPAATAIALAYFKAVAGFERACAERLIGIGSVVLAADTFLVKHGRIIGKPTDRDDARRIIGMLISGSHEVVTGVCALTAGRSDAADGSLTPVRRFMADRASVHVGAVTSDEVEAYIESGGWRGKAGAYNLAERIAAGWPIVCTGDPATVMGLPMRRLGPMLVGLLNLPEPARS